MHILQKVLRDAKIDPPIQTEVNDEYLLSEGATTLTSTPSGTFAISSLLNLAFRPGNIVEPPDNGK